MEAANVSMSAASAALLATPRLGTGNGEQQWGRVPDVNVIRFNSEEAVPPAKWQDFIPQTSVAEEGFLCFLIELPLWGRIFPRRRRLPRLA